MLGQVRDSVNNQTISLAAHLQKVQQLQEATIGLQASKTDGAGNMLIGAGLGYLVGGPLGALISGAKGGDIVNGVKDPWNTVTSNLGKLKFWSTGGMVGADKYSSATGGARSTGGAGIAGEVGPEWIVPTYEPERTKFLSDVGANPDVIASRVAHTIIPIMAKAFAQSQGSQNSGGGDTSVHVYIDGKEISNSVVSRVVGGDRNIKRALSQDRRTSMARAF
jgi:hypothetical protein